MKKVIFLSICMFGFFTFSSAAKLSFSYPQTSLVDDCPSKIDVLLDTEGQMTTAMDLKILFDPSVMSREYFDIDGSVFKTSTLPYFSSADGIQTSYILLSTLSRWGFNGVGKVGTITVIPKLVSDAPYLNLKFSMVPNKDSDDSNVVIVSGGETFDVLDKTSELYLPISVGDCPDIIGKQTVLYQQLGKVTLIQNSSFVSQHPFQEKLDAIVSWLVHNISMIIVVFLALVLCFLARRFVHKNPPISIPSGKK
ncbi:MAG: hypothetical protein CO170_03215 [candidate division SR1 bacterium CG_4_9_14_3_um_filter_40_9]|nr:MAG: hypothetical protein CO170_03215 [candidate division SR1 bacterium CG_4_9_14_3_um_filter_40_9]